MLTRQSANAQSFMPEDYLLARRESKANSINLLLFGVVLCAVVGAFFVTHRQWNTVRAQQQAINAQYATEAEKIEQLKLLDTQKQDMLEKAEITTGLIEKVPRSILLAEVVNRMPERITLAELELKSRRIREEAPKKPAAAGPKSLSASNTKQGGKGGKGGKNTKEAAPPKPRPPKMEFTLSIQGLAASDQDVADYHASLKECGLLERVDLVSTEGTRVQDVPVRRFRIEAQLSQSADARSVIPLSVARLRTPAQLGTRPAAESFFRPAGPGQVSTAPTGGQNAGGER
ncbi:MAG: PilN domain-containing protein [bacterium]|jgi:Tfp pilus assembly protein PilN|nr:PilN domain-containing protein [Phycisphaerales bacterium]MCE2652095.1 PilN domain-containing protein [Planctomycetaceae bacterium]